MIAAETEQTSGTCRGLVLHFTRPVERNPSLIAGGGVGRPPARKQIKFKTVLSQKNKNNLQREKKNRVNWPRDGGGDQSVHQHERGESGKKFAPEQVACALTGLDLWDGRIGAGFLSLESRVTLSCLTPGEKK